VGPPSRETHWRCCPQRKINWHADFFSDRQFVEPPSRETRWRCCRQCKGYCRAEFSSDCQFARAPSQETHWRCYRRCKTIVVLCFLLADNLYPHLQRHTLEVLPPLQKILPCWIFFLTTHLYSHLQEKHIGGAATSVVVLSFFFRPTIGRSPSKNMTLEVLPPT